MGKFLLGLLWLAAATYAGYYLAARSFAFMGDLDLGMMEGGPAMIGGLDMDSIADKLPADIADIEDPAEAFADLTPDQQECVRDAVGSERLNAVLSGEELEPSPLEIIKVSSCLK